MSDVVVVGAGLAGLCAALRLAEAGRRVTVVAKGVGGLPLSPGTVDVLGYDPRRVASPVEALPAFVAAHPAHPYATLAPALATALAWFRDRVPALGYSGGPERNVLLATALGVARPTALVPETMAAGDLSRGGRVAIVGFGVHRDFHPGLVAENLARADVPGGLAARGLTLAASPRPGVADVSGLVLARALDDRAFRRTVADELRPMLEPGERAGFPAVLGLERAGEAWADLQDALGAPVFEIPTPPPSVPGMRLYRALTARLRAAGGRLVVGPEAVGGQAADGRMSGVTVREAGRLRTLPAAAVVLASGGFASGGLALDSRGVLRETVLGLPVEGPPSGVGSGLGPRYLDPHPLMSAGVRVDSRLRPVGPGGEPQFANLHAAGDVLAGAEPWREASGEGLAIAGAHAAASAILGAS